MTYLTWHRATGDDKILYDWLGKDKDGGCAARATGAFRCWDTLCCPLST